MELSSYQYSTSTISNSSVDIKVLSVVNSLTVDLVAKRSGTKASAQWSNDEVVHQILVDLHAQPEEDAANELLKRVMYM